MRLALSLSALAAVLMTATPALAGTSASAAAEVRGLVLQPLTLTKVNEFDFGTVISTAAAGSVTIDANNGARAQTGGMTLVPNYPGSRAFFSGSGTAGQPVVLSLSAPALLVSTTNPADVLAVSSLSLDSLGTNRTVGATSTFSVGVGGDFAIAASQTNVLYTAQFDLPADYQ
ncbi:MAG: hypothetical protein NVS3B5_07770 [Sphingomicrobium sp.]